MARSVSVALGVNNRGPRVDEDKAILKRSVSPTNAVLVEAGRLSGLDEIKLHATGSVEKVASGIAQAVYEFLGK